MQALLPECSRLLRFGCVWIKSRDRYAKIVQMESGEVDFEEMVMGFERFLLVGLISLSLWIFLLQVSREHEWRLLVNKEARALMIVDWNRKSKFEQSRYSLHGCWVPLSCDTTPGFIFLFKYTDLETTALFGSVYLKDSSYGSLERLNIPIEAGCWKPICSRHKEARKHHSPNTLSICVSQVFSQSWKL
jgi:hypothetical protein